MYRGQRHGTGFGQANAIKQEILEDWIASRRLSGGIGVLFLILGTAADQLWAYRLGNLPGWGAIR